MITYTDLKFIGLNLNDLHGIAIALKLDISQIKKIEVWYSVLFVSTTKGVRFVSKSVLYNSTQKAVKQHKQKKLFKRFLKSHVSNWCLYDLKYLTIKQIKSLVTLMGSTASGNKNKLINKLTTIVKTRLLVAPYVKLINRQSKDVYQEIEKVAQAMASEFKHKSLLASIRKLKIFAIRNKHGMAKSLINWLLKCLDRGQKAYQESLQIIKSKNVKQLKLAV